MHCSCGNEFTTRSTVPELRVELCSECHPFYTGKQKLVDTGGRVERFQRRYAKSPARRSSPGERRMADQPRYMGGQAVVEGVMMRGETTWAVAVRTPDGDIDVEVHDAPRWAEKYAQGPAACAGVMNLAESLSLGMKALSWSANQQVPEEERIGSKAMGVTMADRPRVLRRLLRAPARARRPRPRRAVLGIDGFWFHVLEGVLVLGIFLGYLAAGRAHARHQARVPVPRRRAQGDRRVRERRRRSRPSRRSASPPSTSGAARTSCSRCS